MIKEYLEVEYVLLVKNHKFVLTEIVYDLEYDSIKDGLHKIKNEIEHGVESTTLSEGSTINDILIDYNLLDEYKTNGYEYSIKDILKIVSELYNNDDSEEVPF